MSGAVDAAQSETELHAANRALAAQCERLGRMYDELNRSTKLQAATDADTIAALRRRLETMQPSSAALSRRQPKAANDSPFNHEKLLSVKERDSLLKLVIGMAVEGYRFDPRSSRSSVTTEIAGDLAKLGLNLDPDTVRKYLKEAAELLPSEVDLPRRNRIRPAKPSSVSA